MVRWNEDGATFSRRIFWRWAGSRVRLWGLAAAVSAVAGADGSAAFSACRAHAAVRSDRARAASAAVEGRIRFLMAGLLTARPGGELPPRARGRPGRRWRRPARRRTA